MVVVSALYWKAYMTFLVQIYLNPASRLCPRGLCAYTFASSESLLWSNFPWMHFEAVNQSLAPFMPQKSLILMLLNFWLFSEFLLEVFAAEWHSSGTVLPDLVPTLFTCCTLLHLVRELMDSFCTTLEDQHEFYNGFTGEDCLWKSRSLFFLWYTVFLFICLGWGGGGLVTFGKSYFFCAFARREIIFPSQ